MNRLLYEVLSILLDASCNQIKLKYLRKIALKKLYITAGVFINLKTCF